MIGWDFPLPGRTKTVTGAYDTGRLVVGVFDDDKPGGPVEFIEVKGDRACSNRVKASVTPLRWLARDPNAVGDISDDCLSSAVDMNVFNSNELRSTVFQLA